MPQLSEVNLSHNELSDALPPVWKPYVELRIDLSKNFFVGSVPEGWEGGDNSFTVDLTGNSLCGCFPEKWKTDPSLTVNVDPAVTASDCATANVCNETRMTPITTPPAPSPASSNGEAVDSSSRNSHEAGCEVLYCVQCQAGNTTLCGECSQSYQLTANSQCARGDGAVRVSLTAGGHLWSALLFSAALWMCSASL
ncbi:hypothetical protein ABB37_02082 [Leptomonas pyrrhocoris]|uniref:Surface antigen-like protein n=1 Tax=Leptomonas pyrrhocoris TaxID=157538 RepID=A0A0N0DYE4_LEPPY|nr:hypothetical protein ABB37_02082 [Leptomonas pyrrhocoris]KPA83902.1 hypothetical protein ABB37_02082 [Leptomonas pyrrhocoris]|eukprot:XP_015662341.1 hypothetical protein ABB37_02082 [Leptomonas pyrrhocoris]